MLTCQTYYGTSRSGRLRQKCVEYFTETLIAEGVDRRGRWPRRLHYYTKVGSRDRGLVAERSLLESPADVNHALCEAKSGALYGSSPNDRLNYRFKRATVVAATNYKTGDTKIRTD